MSKPVAPPWNDSSKNLVRDLCLGLGAEHTLTVMGRAGGAAVDGADVARVYPKDAGGFSPALADNARVLAHLLAGRRRDLWHFFFAPNPKSAAAGRLAKTLRRARTVQTVCSAPAVSADLSRALFTDRVVVLSEQTHARFIEEGVAEDRVVRIPPSVATLEPLSGAARHEAREHFGLPTDEPVVVYPGDLEFGSGAAACLSAIRAHREVTLAMACRAKTPRAKEVEARLRSELSGDEREKRVVWIGETRRVLDLLGCADVVALPSETLHAKMDYPLVILEAMALGRPVIVGAGTPAEELAGESALVSGVDPGELAEVLSRALSVDGAAGRRYVQQEMSVAAMAAGYRALYEELS